MSAYRKNRSDSLTTESDHRAQKLNQAAGRSLHQQISKYEKEEKHLQREILNLRRARETLETGIKLIMPCRPRSSSDELSGGLGRRNSDFSSHLNEKLPQIIATSPIPSRKDGTPEDPLQWYKTTANGGQSNYVQGKEDKHVFFQCLTNSAYYEPTRTKV